MKLSLFFDNLDKEFLETNIEGLAQDSRKIKDNYIFFAVEGIEADGHNYIESAIERGAVAVVHTKDIEKKPGIAYIKVKNISEEIKRVSLLFFGDASKDMIVFGVTGTDGKSTTTCIIKDIIEAATGEGKSKGKINCGYMGTIAVRYGEVEKKSNLTTPDIIEIQENLRDMKEAGMKAVSMEVSSHGLAQGRVDNVDFDVAAITNITTEHLDFHKTLQGYFEAKKTLFKNMKKDGVAVLNYDDKSFEEFKESCNCRAVTYGAKKECDFFADKIVLGARETNFNLIVSVDREGNSIEPVTYSIKTNLVAKYNIYNLIAAIASLHQKGISIDDMIEPIKNIAQVDGRMEIIENQKGINIIVDYAHTAQGYEKLFEFLKDIRKGHKVIAVLGSAGKRDKSKRPVLGRLAYENCDKIFLTEEDYRDESPKSISEDIIGDLDSSKFTFIEDRVMAIEKAVDWAEEGDFLLILGKGDETYLDRGKGKEPYLGDNKVAEQAAGV